MQADGTFHTYVQPDEVAYQMDELCDWLATEGKQVHPVIAASVAHYNKARIHPFQDGNGRGARLLMNFILMRHQYYPAIIEIEKRREYLASLKAADGGNLLPIIQFTADAVQRTQTMVL